MPVSTSALPLPSSSNSTLMSVSFVLRSTLPFRSMTRLLFEPCFHRARVIVQSLQPRQMSNLRRQGAERLFLCLNDRRTFQKIIGPQRGKKPRAATGGKNMIRPGEIISQGRRRIRADKYRPRVAYRARPFLRLFYNQLDMFWRDGISEVDRLSVSPRNDDRAVFFQRLDGYRPTLGLLQLMLDRLLNPRRHGHRRCYAQGGRTFVVLGLGKHIRGDVLGIGALVREQKNLAWHGDGIDIDFAENQPLRRGDEDISRAAMRKIRRSFAGTVVMAFSISPGFTSIVARVNRTRSNICA